MLLITPLGFQCEGAVRESKGGYLTLEDRTRIGESMDILREVMYSAVMGHGLYERLEQLTTKVLEGKKESKTVLRRPFRDQKDVKERLKQAWKEMAGIYKDCQDMDGDDPADKYLELAQKAAEIFSPSQVYDTVEKILERGNGEYYEARAAKDHIDELAWDYVRPNLKFGISVAKSYFSRRVSNDDLVEDAFLAMHDAGVRFDHKEGYEFITYAVWRIRQKLGVAEKKEDKENWPSMDEGWQYEDSRNPFQNLSSQGISAEEELMETLLSGTIRQMLDELSGRERKVIELRYFGEESMTFEEAGKELGLTRERVRQIEAQAMRKLRHPDRRRKLKAYVN